MNSRDRAARDMAIVAARARGVSVSRVALEHDVSPRRVKQIVATYRETPSTGRDATGEVDAVLELFEQAIEDLGVIVERTNHDGWRVAAITRLAELATARLAILQATGRVPLRLNAMAERAQMQAFLAGFADLLRRHPEVPDEVLREVLELAESMTAKPSTIEGRALPAAA